MPGTGTLVSVRSADLERGRGTFILPQSQVASDPGQHEAVASPRQRRGKRRPEQRLSAGFESLGYQCAGDDSLPLAGPFNGDARREAINLFPLRARGALKHSEAEVIRQRH